jgi:hypothetical protein
MPREPDATEVEVIEEQEEEEEEYVKEQIVAHPTRDDWHEQRERNQTSEASLHARVGIQVTRTWTRMPERHTVARR